MFNHEISLIKLVWKAIFKQAPIFAKFTSAFYPALSRQNCFSVLFCPFYYFSAHQASDHPLGCVSSWISPDIHWQVTLTDFTLFALSAESSNKYEFENENFNNIWT